MMYWKFCATEALENVVVVAGCANTEFCKAGFDWAKAGGIQAAQAVATMKTSRFIMSFLMCC